jgi:uncharacterized membrane protein HdeD (DUF308 family)
MSKQFSTSLILRGVLALIIGVLAIAWPGVTVLALVIMFAIYAFTDAVMETFRAFSGARAWPVFGHLLMGLIDIAAGVVAIAWPGPTAYVLVILVGAWAVVAGIFEFAAGFAAGESAGTRAMLLLGGLVSVAFGVVLFARPNVGALTLALLFGMFALIYGFSQISLGVQLRSTGNAVRSALGTPSAHRSTRPSTQPSTQS